jgi:vacuolar iron transporter family protein
MTNADIDLARLHTREAIAERINSATKHSYFGDFVLGAVDGAITTFAIVAGAAGAGLSGGVALVLGSANVLADGLSMAAGNFLRARSARQEVDRTRREEEMHIELIPEGEREEIRQIFAAKGFDGSTLDEIVNVMTRDRQRWVDTMLTDELGLQLDPPAPFRAALVTMFAFVFTGLVPLLPLPFAIAAPAGDTFVISAVLTGATFFAIGVWRGLRLDGRPWTSGLEILTIGGLAAATAYAVGRWLQAWV